MKALILSCNTGQGHNSVSASVASAFEKRGVKTDTADALAFLSEWASKTICEWHVRLYRYFPKVSGASYSFIEQHPELFDSRSPIHRLLNLGVDKLFELVAKEKYDIIICPHVISALMVTEMTRQYPEAIPKTAFIATDYTCSPMAEESDLDYYFLPTPSLIPDFENIGIAAEKIIPTDGIPVRPDFYSHLDKREAKRMLGLGEDCMHALMMFGSMGCGNMPKLTALISENMPKNGFLTVVCGTNEVIRKKLEKQFSGRENVRVEGFVKDVSTLMDSADLFVTKPGGLSTAEAAVKRLPMLLDNAVSGCEQYNLEYFCSIGAAVTAEGEDDIAAMCVELLKNKEMLERMRERLPERKSAAEKIADVMLSGEQPMMTAEPIGNDFVYWRERCGLSQTELSKMLGIPLRTLKNWESGATEPQEYIKRLIISELKRIERRIKRTGLTGEDM